MITIPIELWPYGNKDSARRLGKLTITNDGTGTPSRGNYNIAVFDPTNRKIRQGRVIDWPRKSRPVYELLLAGLKACQYEERKE